jgi:S-adenosylmethionine synthetase
MRQDFLFTSESVTEGHPDKMCDQIADAILDRFLTQDQLSSVSAECAVSDGVLFLASRFSSRASVDIPAVARNLIAEIGYDRDDFNPTTCTIMTSFTEVPDTSRDGDRDDELKSESIEHVTAKDNANVFGFACTHTATLLPLPVSLAHKLARRLSEVRRKEGLSYLVPDGKAQVGVEFKNRRPHRIHSVTIVAGQSEPDTPLLATLRDDLREHVVTHVFAEEECRPDKETQFFINPEGPFVTGGPSQHAGLTGRKNAIDTYGEYSRHSGAALSGKDPSRIDRVGAYAARYAAKNVVAAGLAEECEVQLSYSIGLARPVSVQIETFGTGTVPDREIIQRVKSHFEFRPAGIVRQFKLRSLPADNGGDFYRRLAAYGHVGRSDMSLPWELTDKADAMR